MLLLKGNKVEQLNWRVQSAQRLDLHGFYWPRKIIWFIKYLTSLRASPLAEMPCLGWISCSG